jgi:hypothetical protein
MDAKELRIREMRIGNLVKDGLTGELMRIVELSLNTMISYVIDREKYPLPEGCTTEPIPLTEEWLIKFGFETDKIMFWNGVMSMGYYSDGFYYCPTSSIILKRGIEIKYVHQLQNLYFALTGNELTIQ